MRLLDQVLFAHASKMDNSKETIRYILQFCFDKSENVSQPTDSFYWS